MGYDQTVKISGVVLGGCGGGVAAVVGDLLVVEGVGGAPGGGVAVEGVVGHRVGGGSDRGVEGGGFGVVLGESGGAGALHEVGARVGVVVLLVHYQTLLLFHNNVVVVGVVRHYCVVTVCVVCVCVCVFLLYSQSKEKFITIFTL